MNRSLASPDSSREWPGWARAGVSVLVNGALEDLGGDLGGVAADGGIGDEVGGARVDEELTVGGGELLGDVEFDPLVVFDDVNLQLDARRPGISERRDRVRPVIENGAADPGSGLSKLLGGHGAERETRYDDVVVEAVGANHVAKPRTPSVGPSTWWNNCKSVIWLRPLEVDGSPLPVGPARFTNSWSSLVHGSTMFQASRVFSSSRVPASRWLYHSRYRPLSGSGGESRRVSWTWTSGKVGRERRSSPVTPGGP